MVSLRTPHRIKTSAKISALVDSDSAEKSYNISETFQVLKKSLLEAEKEYSIRKSSERFYRFHEKAQSCRHEIINHFLIDLPINQEEIIRQSFLHAMKNILTLNILRHETLSIIMENLENSDIDISSLRENELLDYSELQRECIEKNRKYFPYINILMSEETNINSMEYKQLERDENWALDRILNQGLTLHFYCDVLGYDYEAIYGKIKTLGSISLDELINRKSSLLNHFYDESLGTSILKTQEDDD
ncbi:MAG: hypothetical protein UT06_C0051G0005 [Candidatus Woesebacteria bacterium GW2011_GWA1_38_8]|uniref:Uncharacterized protein n=1 Tax=Candidatus Woesebacteria bacterium GW2011_GWA1_38_8 TaxID=1618547 RepID=A0A0G0N8A2_9BACT|nr:MAG: hypothetical protein UT06_C0051G0005 [Candidatus Woesebacteria bacterium GW2011_GWA1_38_8]